MAESKSLAERFWPKVQKGMPHTCWAWLAYCDRNGYGRLCRGGRRNSGMMFAHRASWIINKGAIPDHLCVLHRCDNPACVNPHHLFLGTQIDNLRDMTKKGRRRTTAPKGEANHLAKLTAKQVVAIRNSDASNQALARKFGVYDTCIMKIRARQTWPHLP